MMERLKIWIGQRLFVAFNGLTVRRWFRLLRENRFAVEPRYWPRAALLTAGSLGNSVTDRLERLRYGRAISAVPIEHPPLFILGHWRSGTTHLHNLLSLDERFAFSNFYQVQFPLGFLLTERINKPIYSLLMPAERQIDRVSHSIDVPAEDEFAIAQLSLLSSYLGWMFPQRMDVYDKYLTLQDATDEEVERWKQAMENFVRRMTLKTSRPLVLKSPPHTCRIRLLLEIFPDAKFVHIHRHPFEVFPSTKRMTEVIVRWTQLQTLNGVELEERIIRQYREMYEVYFDQRRLIPSGRLFELDYESLKTRPLESLERIYDALQLPEFGEVEPKFRAYLESIADYRPSTYRPLPEPLCSRLRDEWRHAFTEFGYSTEQQPFPMET